MNVKKGGEIQELLSLRQRDLLKIGIAYVGIVLEYVKGKIGKDALQTGGVLHLYEH